MKNKILDLIDFEKVDTLLEGFNKTTGFVTAILDLEGNVLSKSGWRTICTEFHRIHPETSKRCAISDTVLANKMAEGENYHFYQCLNGLVDVAVPIIIKGEHIANLFSGQFFFEEPDGVFFQKQAAKYGFNQEKYLQAFRNVPVVSKEKVTIAMDFLLNMTQLISDTTLQKLEQMELNEMIRKSEERFRSIFENNLATMLLIEPSTHRILDANSAAETFYGWSRSQLSQMTIDQINTLPSDELQKEMEIARSQQRIYFKFKHRLANGLVRDVEIYSSKVEIDGKDYLHSIIHDITEQVKSENKIKNNERILRLFVEHSPASIAMFDNNMRYLVASKRFLADYNLGDQNLIGLSHYEVFPEISEQWKEFHRRGLAGETLKENNDPFLRADGKTDWVRWEIRPWYETGNQIGGIILFSEVITQQVEAELDLAESEKYNRMLFEQSAIGLALTSFDGRLVDINTTFSTIIGRTVEEAKALTYWDFTPEKYQNQEQQQLDLIAKTGRYGPYEKEYIHKDGHLVPVRLQGLVIERNNEKFIWSSVEDITLRKQTEENLAKTNRLLLDMMDNSSALIYMLDPEGRFITVNRQLEKLFQKTRDEITGWSRERLMPKEVAAQHYLNDLEVMKLRKAISFEEINQEEDGLHYYLTTKFPLIDSRNELYGISGISTDITDRKQAEKLLKDSEETYRNIFEFSPIAAAFWDKNAKIIYWNKAAENVFGWNKEDVIGRKFTDFFIPESSRKDVEKNIDLLINNISSETTINENLRKDGSAILCEWTNTIIHDKYGNPSTIISLAKDVTEQRRAEEKLKQSEEKFNKAFHNSPDSITITRASDGTMIDVNERLLEISGYSREEIIGNTKVGLDFWVNTNDFDQYVSILKKEGRVLDFETDFRTKSGTVRNFSLSGETFVIGGEPFILGIMRDITDHKKTEEALQQSEYLLAEAERIGNTGSWSYDVALETARWSANMFRIFDVNPETSKVLVFKFFIENVVHPDDRGHVLNIFQRTLEGKCEYDLEYRIIRRDGTVRIIHALAQTLRDTHGNILQLIGWIEDITERKLAEEKIRENSSLIRIAAEKAKLGGWNVDLKENRSYWSDEVAAIHEMPAGYAPLVEDGINFYAPEWRERIIKVFTDCAQNGVPYDEEMEIITATGKRVWVRTIGEAVRDETGKIFKVQGAFQDISERKLAEEKSREKDLQFRKLSANVPDLLFQFTRRPDGTYCVPVASEGIMNIFGCSPEDVVDDFTPIGKVIHPDDAVRVIAEIENSAKNLSYFTCEFRVQIPGRPVQWILSRSTPEKLPDGSITWYGFNADITQRKEFEDVLRESEGKFRKIYEEGPFGMALVNSEFKFMMANRTFCDITGYNESELRELTFSDISFIDDRDIGVESIKKLIKGEIPVFRGEKRYVRKDGTVIWGAITVTANFDKKGNFLYNVSIVEDITGRKQAEDALKESEERLKILNEELEKRILARTKELNDLYDNAPCGYHSLNKDGLIIHINETELKLLGYSREEVINSIKIMDMMTPESQEKFKINYPLFMKEGLLKDFELDFIRKDRTILPILLTATAVYDSDNNYLMSRSTLIDNTDLKQAKDEILKAKTTLEAANKELETFTYSVSHDLKAPLRGIDGYSKLLLDNYSSNLNEEASHFIKTIRSSTLQMNQLIEDLLQYSRLERSQMQIKAIKIRPVIESILKTNEDEIEANHFLVQLNVPDTELIADTNGIQIALRNLIGNAIKFSKATPSPEIYIGFEETNEYWIISVKDNGIGFKMKYNERIFEIFQRLQRAEDYPGTGIGLAMVAKAMQRMNGKARAESVPERGASFYLEIPKTNQLWKQ